MKARISLTALFLAAFLTSAAQADVKKEFMKSWQETQNSWERITLINGLDPSDKDALKVISDFVLKKQDWYYREAAIDVLAGAYAPEILEALEKLGKRGDPMVAAGVVMAFGRSGNTDRVPWVAEQLEHKKWKVQRAAAIALGHLPDKRAVEPLIKAWEENEDEFMVWVHILEALEKITREKNMPRHQDTWSRTPGRSPPRRRSTPRRPSRAT
jgi:HEAT repeat protein